MILKAVSPLKEREYPDQQSGELRKAHWVELTLTDGLDTMIGELTVYPQRDVNGQMTVQAPAFQLDVVYGVSAEISGVAGVKDGREWYKNKINIRKIEKL